jgi:hypothetical protein
MPNWFKPNIQRNGRLLRGVLGLALIIGGLLLMETRLWLTLLLFAGGAFAIFEALQGWCAARACGIKTRL